MSFKLPFGVEVLNPVPTDTRRGPYTHANETGAKALAVAGVPAGVRGQGQQVDLIIAGNSHVYVWANGVADTDLVPLETPLPQPLDTTDSPTFANITASSITVNGTTQTHLKKNTGGPGSGLLVETVANNVTSLLDLTISSPGTSGAVAKKNYQIQQANLPDGHADATFVIGLQDGSGTMAYISDIPAPIFLGTYASLSALNITHPTANAGQTAEVITGGGVDNQMYFYDGTNARWDLTGTGSGGSFASLTGNASDNASLSTALGNKVDKVTGKGLSTNDYTTTEQAKLFSIATGATANTDTNSLSEGASNLYFTVGRVLATLLTGIGFSTTGAVVATDSILTAFGKLQKQITDAVTSISGKVGKAGDTMTGALTSPNYFAGTSAVSTAGKTAVFYGDSWTVGQQASTTAKRWSSVLCSMMGWTESNFAISGTVLMAQSENLTNNMVSRASATPIYDPAVHSYFFLAYGYNDDQFNYTDFTTTNFITDYNSILTTILITKGWPSSKVVLISNGYHDATKYGVVIVGNSASTPTRSAAFRTAIASVAASNNTKYVDINPAFVANGGLTLISDGIHPNDYGYAIVAETIAKAIGDGVVFGTQPFAVNGMSDVDSLHLNRFNLLNNDAPFLLGVDANNNVGMANALPNLLRAQQLNFDGLKQWNYFPATIPTAVGLLDIVVKSDTRYIAMHPNNYYAEYIAMVNGTGATKWTNNVGQFEWWVAATGGGTPALAFLINTNKQLCGTGALPPNTSPGMWQQYGAAYGAATGSTYGQIKPCYADGTYGDGMFLIENAYNQGKILFKSNGVIGAAINQSANWVLQNGGTYEDWLSSKFSINSTTKGWTPPSMTQTQRDAILKEKVIAVTVLTGGSGYTNGATFTFANGSITNIGASGMIAATGGVITGITIPSGNQGYGYTTPPTTGTSGTGTGFTFTAIMGWKENLCIFNTTTGHFNIVVGGAWVEVSNTNSAETLTNKTLTSPQLTPLTVATLPTSPTAGMMACVTDAATLPTMGAAVGSGGGSYFAGVMYNGTQWSVFSL